jgi:hypothetical protein
MSYEIDSVRLCVAKFKKWDLLMVHNDGETIKYTNNRAKGIALRNGI